jgi:hypothetical protein
VSAVASHDGGKSCRVCRAGRGARCVICGVRDMVVGGIGWIERVVVLGEAWVGVGARLRWQGIGGGGMGLGGSGVGDRRRESERERVDIAAKVIRCTQRKE